MRCLNIFCLSGFLIPSVTLADGLTPPGPPQDTMRSLNEVFNAVTKSSGGVVAEQETLAYLIADSPFFANVSNDASGTDSLGEELANLNRENFITVVNFSLKQGVPVNESGAPIGTPVPPELTITKYIDKASPIFSETLDSTPSDWNLTLRLERMTQSGPEHYYTIECYNSVLTSYEVVAPNLEKLTFYTELNDLSITHEISGTSSSKGSPKSFHESEDAQ